MLLITSLCKALCRLECFLAKKRDKTAKRIGKCEPWALPNGVKQMQADSVNDAL